MKKQGINFIRLLQTIAVSFLLIPLTVIAQSNCSAPKDHSFGYSTSISSVTENEDGSYTIILRVRHNGCPGPECNSINHYYVEADPGSYSDVSWALIYGDVSYNGIVFGPDLGGWDKQGFKIASINGMGNGDAGIFSVTYTLSELQDQAVMVKAGNNLLEVSFTEQEFIYVLDCKLGGSYAMPTGGKLTYTSNKIGNELTALSEYNGIPESNEVYQIVFDEGTGIYYVVAEFTPEDGQYTALYNELETNYGLRAIIPDVNQLVITGQIPIDQLTFLNDLPDLFSAKPVYPVTTNTGLIATSQGDTSMISNIAREIFTVQLSENDRRSVTGEGIKIGVISNSYNTKTNPSNQANDDVLKFELPGIGIQSDTTEVPNPYNDTDVQVLMEYPYGEASDEGRAMMQIIHDVAPGADMAFRTGVLGAVDLHDAIHELASNGCDIIMDDVTYISEPFFEDGIIAQAVDDVVSDDNISYFTSAGNFGIKSHTAEFNPTPIDLGYITGEAHIFGINEDGDDIYQSITAFVDEDANSPQIYTLVLQWEDDDPASSFNSTNTDMDIYLFQDGGGMIGYNTINTGNKSVEVLPFVATETTNIDIVIVKASDNETNVTFKYVIFKGQVNINEYTGGDATIVGHANSAGAMTVGAIRYDKTPAYEGELEIMSFSSHGGLLVDGINRNKPDFTAPNGVNTTVDLGNGDWDHETDPEADTDLLPNFFGTSASAPHAAAVAALLMDAKESYYNLSMAPAEVRSVLSATAIGADSYGPVYGNGFIQADAALLTLANPAPIIYELMVDTEGIPGLDPISITVTGSYLTPDTKLHFNGVELVTNVDLTAGTLSADLPAFSDLYPPITASNPPITPTEKDGGMSNALYFTEKPIIIGSLDDITKAYGEDMPDVNIEYEIAYIDGTFQALEEADLTSAQVERITNISLSNNADALADVGIWPYYIPLEEVLNPLYDGSYPPVPSTEDSLLSNFDFNFNLGNLEILRLELTITPDDLTLDYGDPISGFTYTFSYDDTNISNTNNDIIQDSLLLAYQGDIINDITALVDTAFYMADSSGGLVPNSYFMSDSAYSASLQNGQSLALVNGKSLALVNGQSLALVNGQSLALVNQQSLALVNGQSLALVNAEALINGQSLALVNTEAQTNGLSLALVNAQSLALVNNPDPLWDEAFLNGQSLALVNTGALTNGQSLALVNEGGGLVNGQSLALVNSISFNEVTNKEAVIILTVDDILTMMEAGSTNSIELISINTVSGNTVTNSENPHKIAPGAFIASNFNVEYELGNLTINKADLEVTGESHVINEGMAAPEYSFSYSGFVEPDDEISVFGTEGPAYSIINPDDNSLYDSVSSGPGEYLVEFPLTDNYNIIFPVAINLFVNPDGNNTKSVVPKLDCVTEDGNGNYTAYFNYENKNDDPVWVLIGPNNLVTGGNDPDISQQPFKFEAGGGTWEAYFDGSDMTWSVSSQHQGHKTSHAQDASSNSKNCNKSVEEKMTGDSEEFKLSVYPNPVKNKLHISVMETSTIEEVSISNMFGKLTRVSINRISKQNVEVNMSELPSGIFIVTVQLDFSTETIKIVKQ